MTSQLSIEEFGTQLIKTGDLDPVYTAIHGAQLERDTKWRLVLAYWCFYSLATAARLATYKKPTEYWDAMMEAASYSPLDPKAPRPWPRGSERRHYRGDQAKKSMIELITKYKTPVDAILGFVGPQTTPTGRTYGSVSRAAQSHRGFGEWISFKVADMSERVFGFDVNFDDCHLGIYKDPRQGAALAWYEGAFDRGEVQDNTWQQAPWDYPITDQQLADVVQDYIWRFRKLKAPPAGDRKVNVQEVETIFCKYKSYRKGHYPPGKDIREIRHGLESLPSPLGDRLLSCMPEAA
jgi:hypothetical protein